MVMQSGDETGGCNMDLFEIISGLSVLTYGVFLLSGTV